MAPAYKSRGGPSGSSSAGRPKGKFSMCANQNPVGGPARGPAARATGAERAGSKQQPQQPAGAAKRKRPTAPRRDEPDSDDDEEDSEGGDEEGDVEAGESEVDTDGEIEKTTKSKKTQSECGCRVCEKQGGVCLSGFRCVAPERGRDRAVAIDASRLRSSYWGTAELHHASHGREMCAACVTTASALRSDRLSRLS